MADVTPAAPPWWDALTEHPALRGYAIDWRPPADWEPPVKDDGMGTITVEALEEADAELRAGKVLVGTGPSTRRRGMGYDLDAGWYLDPAEPDRLWCALSDEYPAWLWIPVEPDAGSVIDVLSGTFPRPERGSTELTSFARGFLGFTSEVRVPNVYSGDFVGINGADLDRYFTFVPFVEPQSWGSAHQDDPLVDDPGEVSPLAFLAAAKEGGHKQQRIGAVPAMTFRTVHSRSYLSFEIHSRVVVCAAIRYRPAPAPHRAVVAAVNERFETCFPADLPLDVIGALTGFDYADESVLEANLTDSDTPEQLALGLRIFAALWCGDLRRTLRLRDFASNPDPVVRRGLALVAHWYDYRFLLAELLLHETDPGLSEQLRALLLRGCDPDAYNAFGDHVDGVPLYVDGEGNEVEVENPWSDEDGDVPEGER